MRGMSDRKSDGSGMDVYLRLLEYAKPHWRMFLFSLLGMAGFAAADVSFVALMRPLLDGSFVDKDPAIIARMPWSCRRLWPSSIGTLRMLQRLGTFIHILIV